MHKAAIRLSRRSLGIERRGPEKTVRQNLCSILTQGFAARRKSSAERNYQRISQGKNEVLPHRTRIVPHSRNTAQCFASLPFSIAARWVLLVSALFRASFGVVSSVDVRRSLAFAEYWSDSRRVSVWLVSVEIPFGASWLNVPRSKRQPAR